MTAVNDRSNLTRTTNTQSGYPTADVPPETTHTVGRASLDAPAARVDRFDGASGLRGYCALSASHFDPKGSGTFVLNPSAEDFAATLAQKYAPDTLQTWSAVASNLTDFFVSMMGAIAQQITASDGSDGTTPTANTGADFGYYTPGTLKDEELFGDGGPKGADVQQGELGDCYFLSQLAGVANEDPNVIKNNIKERIDPTTGKTVYDVTFYKDGPNGPVPVVVTVNDDILRNGRGVEEYAQTVDGDKDGKWEMWVAIYEKAYAVFRSGDGNVDDGYAAVGDGGLGDEAYFAITGKHATPVDPATLSDAQFIDILSRANPASGDCIMLGSKGTTDDQDIAPGIPGGHAYTVLGTYVDPNTGETMVTIRNPWGCYEPGVIPQPDGTFKYEQPPFDGTNDGIFSLPLSQVRQDFDVVTYPDDSNVGTAHLLASYNPPRA